jgi:uncharacterized membrane protein
MKFILAAALLVAGTVAAQAEFRICNQSTVLRSVAIGYSAEGTWTSEGWWIIKPGACAVPIKTPLKNRYIYWRATTPGEEFQHESYMFCVTSQPFTIEGAEDCAARGYEEAGFKVADTGTKGSDYTLTLEPATAKAPEAGVPDTKAPAEKPPKKTKPVPADSGAVAKPGLTGPVPATGPAFAPGQLGEPFSQSALMQGCDTSDTGFACTLYAEGWRYVARPNQPTPKEIITVLSSLPPNTPVILTGEIVQEGDISAEVNLSRIEPGPVDPKADLRAALQGNWVSVDDPQAKIRIIGSEMTDIYGQEVLGTSVVTIGPACPDGTIVQGDALTLRMMGHGDDEPICWAIEEVTADSLTATYMGRGNTLAFHRP